MATGAALEPVPPADGGGERPRRLSEELMDLQGRFAERAVTLREVIVVLCGRAYLLLVILLALPFCAPVSLPGLSTPLGAVIALISLRLALGQRPWLPERLLDWRLPPGFFVRVFRVTARLLRFLETLLRPRATAFVEARILRNLHAVVMLVAAGVLLLPLPIPLSNTFPAWTVILIAAGLLERDGAFVAAGYAMFAAGTAYFVLLGGAAHQLIDAIRNRL
ncbi:MAG TPA: exopolysaccharide biosynthesis protein [Opitutaceae bacterium]|nr:exopolysaccharide biosynthesis protein [Opitutaceae bacterium]